MTLVRGYKNILCIIVWLSKAHKKIKVLILDHICFRLRFFGIERILVNIDENYI